MPDYVLRVELHADVPTARHRVEAALAAQGFGVMTEIDIADVLKRKLGITVPEQVILGACSPALANEALGCDESIGVVLPCNVVLREGGSPSAPCTVVEAIDPAAIVALTNNAALTTVADKARSALHAALVDTRW